MNTRNCGLLRRLGRVGGIGVIATGFCSLNAAATGFVYQFNNAFSGGAPGGPAPWVDATFQDTANAVLLTVNNLGLTGGEFLDALYLNINPVDTTLIGNL